MKIKPLIEKFSDCGCIIFPTSGQKILDLPRNEIIQLFEKYGVIIFKDFGKISDNILEFSNKYTLSYANDAQRREKKMGSDKLHGVDEGNLEMPMHSEASYSPAWPEIIWFYCNLAPKNSGQTTVCDGQSIYKNLNASEKKFFLENQILYDLKIPYGEEIFKNKNSKNKLKPWHIDHPGVKDCFINFSKKEIVFKLKRYAINKLNYTDKLAFVNHLQIILNRDPQVLNITMENGKKVPPKIMKKVKKVSDDLTVDINWKNHDLCMIDNRRFMHGRREINSSEKRDIMVIQTLKSNNEIGLFKDVYTYK